MPQKEEVNVIDQSTATPSADAYFDGGATPSCLDVRTIELSESGSLEKARFLLKSSRAWRKLPLLKNLLSKEGKVDYIGDWREEEEVTCNYIYILLESFLLGFEKA